MEEENYISTRLKYYDDVERRYKSMEPDSIVGTRVKYYDYLDSERFGKIIAVEPYPYHDDMIYCYIEDDDMEENMYEDVVNGEMIRYAALRVSVDIYLDE